VCSESSLPTSLREDERRGREKVRWKGLLSLRRRDQSQPQREAIR